MCVAVPAKVVEVDTASGAGGSIGTVDLQGNRVEVSLALTPDAGVGDWVLIHAGFAIEVLDEADARETWTYLSALNAGGPEPTGNETEPS
ncbi:MAG: HypC/HybG/HupF family hydrogenase formation chaperone [Phycisphaerae bacterium]|jgi:hydrogenase expression/formation protein HypC